MKLNKRLILRYDTIDATGSGVELRTLLREPRFESCAAKLNLWGICFFILHYSSSLSCMNEYMATNSGKYLYEQPSRINCSVAGCFPEKLRRCLIEQIC